MKKVLVSCRAYDDNHNDFYVNDDDYDDYDNDDGYDEDDNDEDGDDDDKWYEESLSVLPSLAKFSLALVPSTSPPPSNTFYWQ